MCGVIIPNPREEVNRLQDIDRNYVTNQTACRQFTKVSKEKTMKLDKLIQLRKTISAHAHEAISAPLAYKMMKFLKASDNEDARLFDNAGGMVYNKK